VLRWWVRPQVRAVIRIFSANAHIIQENKMFSKSASTHLNCGEIHDENFTNLACP